MVRQINAFEAAIKAVLGSRSTIRSRGFQLKSFAQDQINFMEADYYY